MTDYYEIVLGNGTEIDIEDAVEWYDSKKRGLGFEFAYAVEEKLEALIEFPYMYPIIYKTARQVLLNKFPYAIFYYIEEQQKTVNVIAIISTHRNPDFWRKRI